MGRPLLAVDTTSGPKITLVLFVYGDIFPQTHISLMRDSCRLASIRAIAETKRRVIESGGSLGSLEPGDKSAELIVILPPQDAMIERSRALAVKHFLTTDSEVLVMIDHDIQWRGARECEYEGDVLNLARHCQETRGVVGGIVALKGEHQGVAVIWRDERIYNLGSDGIIPVHFVGAAFTAYHRDVLEAISGTMDEVAPGYKPIFRPLVVEHPLHPGKQLDLSEDWALCHRAHQMGFPVHVATAPLLSHWGRKPFNVVGDSEPEPLEDLKAPDFEAMPTKITLLHATRGRPEKSDAARRLWLERSSGRHEIEYIVSIDDDDELMDAVEDIPCDRLIIGKNRGNVDAYNAAYKEATGSILIQMHDDVVPPFHWDRKVANRIGSTKHAVLRVSDGQTCNPHNPGLLTVLIGTKDYFDSLGYFYYPEYVSIYCDDDITCKAERDGVIIEAQDIRFKHAWHGGDDDADETYKRSYRDENWKTGRAIIERRFADDFKK